MLTNDLRPMTFDKVVGQDLNVNLLKAIIKNPVDAPRTLIFEGGYGTGKSSCAKIFARELNNIKDPNYNLNSNSVYNEYDSTVIGNKQEIKFICDNIYTSNDYWTIINFEEFHTASQKVQSILLKTLEEIKGKIFFIICTTEINKVINTIRSRALELNFATISNDLIINHLKELSIKNNINIPNNIKKIIAENSKGHMRNVHMLIDKFILLGEDDFINSGICIIDILCNYFISIKKSDTKSAIFNLNKLMNISVDYLKNSMEEFFWLGMNSYSGESINNSDIDNLIKCYGEDFMKLTDLYFSDVFNNAYRSERDFKTCMLWLYQTLTSN